MPARKNRPGKCGTPLYLPDLNPTPEERLLLAIFGRRPGETYTQALLAMRANAAAEEM